MDSFPIDGKNKVKRVPKRGHYDHKTVFEILDAGFIAHVSFIYQDRPFIIPTSYGRDGTNIYFHGATKSRMLQAMEKGIPVSFCVTHVDALVLARSLFHHSMNYRSAVIFGTARLVSETEEKLKGLEIISDQILKGRWQEARMPNPKEMKATSVLKLEIENASAKIRTGAPGDEPEDYNLPVWAGVLPMEQKYGEPIADPASKKDMPLPISINNILKKN